MVSCAHCSLSWELQVIIWHPRHKVRNFSGLWRAKIFRFNLTLYYAKEREKYTEFLQKVIISHLSQCKKHISSVQCVNTALHGFLMFSCTVYSSLSYEVCLMSEQFMINIWPYLWRQIYPGMKDVLWIPYTLLDKSSINKALNVSAMWSWLFYLIGNKSWCLEKTRFMPHFRINKSRHQYYLHKIKCSHCPHKLDFNLNKIKFLVLKARKL